MATIATHDAARNSVSRDNCHSRYQNQEWRYRAAISWRKNLILHRAAFSRAWDRMFPKHNFGTGRLRQYPLDSFERACDHAEAAAAKLLRNPRIEHLRKLLEDDVPIDRVWNDLNGARSRPTPQTTIEAIVLSVQQHGLEALEYPVNVERLSRCSKGAKTEINRRIAKLRNASDERA
jgi:hypothetical protein